MRYRVSRRRVPRTGTDAGRSRAHRRNGGRGPPRAWSKGKVDDDEALDKVRRIIETGDDATQRRRRKLTPAQLETVAEAYTSGGAGRVAKAMDVGARQASRYVVQARKAGLLTDPLPIRYQTQPAGSTSTA